MTEPASNVTALVPALSGERGRFQLADVNARDGRLLLTLRHEDTGATVEASVGRSDQPGAVLRGERASLAYSTDLSSVTAVERAELKGLFERLVVACDAWLAERDGASPADLLEELRFPADRVTFTPEGLLALLGRSVNVGSQLPGGWRLDAIYPSSHLNDQQSEHLSLILELNREGESALRIEVRARDDQSHAYARTAHFDLLYLRLGRQPSEAAEEACRWLTMLLKLRDRETLEVDFPALDEDVASLERRLAPKPSAKQSLNLAIDAACGQRCAFCSVLEVSPPWSDGDDSRLARLLADLRSNAEAGVRHVRFNGYDPLAFGPILRLARASKDLGYERATVFSPCTRLADERFLDDLLAGLPEVAEFHVPVYGATAEVHDAVVGRAGAFERVEKALKNLGERVPRERLTVLAVPVHDNVEGLLDLREWALRRVSVFWPHAAYPSSESPTDRFRDSAPRFSTIAEATLKPGAKPLIVAGVPPCVYYRRAKAIGLSVRRWLREPDEAPRLPGREYVSPEFRHRSLPVQHSAFVAPAVECPHHEECSLGTACPKEVLRGYADLYGLEELAPVSLSELLELDPEEGARHG